MLLHLWQLKSPRYSEYKKVLNFSGGKDSLYLYYHYSDIIDAVVFADTHYEHPETYVVCRHVQKDCEKRGIPFFWVSSNLDFIEMIKYRGVPNKSCRWCNSELKVKPMRRLLDLKYGKKVICLIGYTYDEVERSNKNFVQDPERYYCFPLIDDHIQECQCRQFAINGHFYPPDFFIKYRHSNCIVCPFMWDCELPYIIASYPDVALKMAEANEEARFKYRYSLSHMLQQFLDEFREEIRYEL